MIFGFSVQVLHFFTVPETRSSIILDREAKKRRSKGEEVYGPNEANTDRLSFWDIMVIWGRPFHMLFTVSLHLPIEIRLIMRTDGIAGDRCLVVHSQRIFRRSHLYLSSRLHSRVQEVEFLGSSARSSVHPVRDICSWPGFARLIHRDAVYSWGISSGTSRSSLRSTTSEISAGDSVLNLSPLRRDCGGSSLLFCWNPLDFSSSHGPGSARSMVSLGSPQ